MGSDALFVDPKLDRLVKPFTSGWNHWFSTFFVAPAHLCKHLKFAEQFESIFI